MSAVKKAAAPTAPAPASGPAAPPPVIRSVKVNHTGPLVLAVPSDSPLGRFVVLEPRRVYELRKPQPDEDPRSVLDPELWAAAKARKSVLAWLAPRKSRDGVPLPPLLEEQAA